MLKTRKILSSIHPCLYFLLPFVVAMSSCSDDEEVLLEMTVDDAAALIGFSMADQTYGAVNDLNYVAEDVIGRVACDETETLQWSYTDSGAIEDLFVSAEILESYTHLCGGEETLDYAYNADQIIFSDLYDLDHDIEGDWLIQGVQLGGNVLIYNGLYNRLGDWTYQFDSGHTEYVEYLSTLINIRYDRIAGKIVSGVSTFTIEGTSNDHQGYNYSGDLEFFSGLAIITFSGGERFEIDLDTGNVTKLE
ncbi:MAG: hypothetical protein AAFV80_08825 [Bacteroidota bacterium]